MVMANWLGMQWGILGTQLKLLTNLSTARVLKKDNNEDTDGEPSTNIRGYELQSLSLAYKVGSAGHADARREYETWENLVGEIGPFYLGGRRFGPAKYQLIKVSPENVLLNGYGDIIECEIHLEFQEYTEEPAGKKYKNSRKSSTNQDAAGIAIGSGTDSAVNIGATAADKSGRKPANSQL